MNNLVGANKKERAHGPSRLLPQHAGRPERGISSQWSRLRTARMWVIGALLTGLASTITTVIISLTQKERLPLTPSNQAPRSGRLSDQEKDIGKLQSISRQVPRNRSSPPYSEDNPRKPAADSLEKAPSDVPRARARLLRRLIILLLLAIIGLAAGTWAIVLFPARSPVVDPTPFNIVVGNKFTLSQINLTISPRAQSTKITFTADRTSSNKTQLTALLAFYISGKFPISCSSGLYCTSRPLAGLGDETEITALITNSKQYTAIIKDPQFGLSRNGESAIAELPGVEGIKPGGSTQLYINYDIPDSDTYDWSLPPLFGSQGGSLLWTETLNNSLYAAQPTEITGINHQAQAQDDRDTFVSGILLGVAGAAAIAVVQEGLHMLFDDRNHRRTPGQQQQP